MVGEPVGRWSPWRHLRQTHPDVRVHEVELPPGLMGCLDHHKRLIWLDSRLSDVERTCTLAHELGHLDLDVVCGRRVMRATEWEVDRWAACRLIRIRSLARAFLWSAWLPEIADQLGVDLPTLRVRLRTLTDEEQDAIMQVIERMRAA